MRVSNIGLLFFLLNTHTGTVWGGGEIAYRCRTCEKDPTCAICATCFENGDHEGHDYFMIYTGGGCCDCGDPEAWKEEGFCKHHRVTSSDEPCTAPSFQKETETNLPISVDALFTPAYNFLLSPVTARRYRG